MKIIPAINCKDFKCVKAQIEKVAEFLPKNGWIQIDVSDGKFTKAKTYNNAKRVMQIAKRSSLKLEVHLMVNNPKAYADKWLKAGADRVIVHIESILTRPGLVSKFGFRKEIGLAIKPETEIKKLFPYLDKIKFIQLLAVKPGYSGQRFNKHTVNKIKFLKKNYPKAVVEIDGGINPKTVQIIKKAGADIAASASYIFDSQNSKEAYKKLLN